MTSPVTIEILSGGLLSTIQDHGRHGLRRFGVPSAGTLAPAWRVIANALVGNPDTAPIIESFEGGLRLRANGGPMRIACAGDGDIALVQGGERRTLAPWRSHVVEDGAELALRGGGHGRLTTLAIAGLEVPHVLGSASTLARAGLGGVDGRHLAAGDRLTLLDAGVVASDAPDLGCEPWAPPRAAGAGTIALDAVPGPQRDAFDEATLDAFFGDTWTLSSDADRMGARLEGTTLRHRTPADRDIVSDAIVAGSVQVPGGGQPIVMLADAHTAGGYPKIATVTSSTLARLAVQRPGTRFTIARVTVETAIERARAEARALARHLDAIRTVVPDKLDTARLLAHNLVDGVTDGEPDDA